MAPFPALVAFVPNGLFSVSKFGPIIRSTMGELHSAIFATILPSKSGFTIRPFLVTVRIRARARGTGIVRVRGRRGEEAGALGRDTAGTCTAGTYPSAGVSRIPTGPGASHSGGR